MPIQDYSTDPDLNTTIEGINIAEGCPPSGINNAIRQLMADVKEESEAVSEAVSEASSALEAFAETQAQKDAAQDEAIAGKLDKSGGTLTGILSIGQYVGIYESVESGSKGIGINANSSAGRGATIALRDVTSNGSFALGARDATVAKYLMGYVDGTLTWGGSSILTAAGGTLIATGMIVPYAANSTPSGGFLLCNGAAVSRTTYAALFSAIGTTYGTGDGSTTFNLPNLTDKFIQGSGTAGTTKAAGLPNITGTFSEIRKDGTGPTATGAFSITGTRSTSSDGNGTGTADVNFKASRSSSIYGASSTVQPPALTMRFYIKY